MSGDYHRQTAYTRDSLGGHTLDWSCQPDPFKRYKDRQTSAPGTGPPASRRLL